MLNIIIPSFDRPAQLDCLLRSLLRYWDFNDLSINILYKYSNQRFAEGYQKLFRKHWYVNPFLEYDFCRQIKELILHNIFGVVGFFTDDCVIYRETNLFSEEIAHLLKDNHCVSLRLGYNTIIQNYLTGEEQSKRLDISGQLDYIRYNYKGYPQYSNYGYLFSWDGCFYSKGWVWNYIKDRNFENPRALEHQLNSDINIRLNSNKHMVCQSTSSIFVNTVNAVQNNDIQAGTKYSYSPEYLNEKWLNGEQISLRSFYGIELYSCHEEYPLLFHKETPLVVLETND